MVNLADLRQFLSGDRKDASSKPPWLLAWRSSTAFIVLTVSLAIFTDIFFYALIIPVIPFSLTQRVGLAEDQVQHWTSILLALYSLALLIGSPIAGLYADHTSSRRWPLLLGLVALAGSTLLLCFGRSIGLLALGRVFQGLSAAIVWSVGCALLVDTMDSAVGVAMGYVNIAMAVGLLIAPVIGGSVYAAAGYYAVYYIAFGVVAVDIVLRLAMIEKKVARQWLQEGEQQPVGDEPRKSVGRSTGSTDTTPTATEIGPARNSAVEPSVLEKAQEGPRQQETEVSGATSKQQPGTIRSVTILLKSSRLLAALYALTAQASIMMGFDATLALFVQSTFHWSSTAAGVLFLAVFVPSFVAPLVGWLADRYGSKWLSFAGFTASIPMLVCLRFVTEDTTGQKVLLAALLALSGLAICFSNTPLMAEISYTIEDIARRHPGAFGEKSVYGLGYGLFTMAFALGGVVGPLWGGYMLAGPGWGTMVWSLAVLAASAAAVVLVWVGGKPKFLGGTPRRDAVEGEAAG